MIEAGLPVRAIRVARRERVMFDYARLKTDLLALAILAVAVFVGLSLVSHDAADPPAMGMYPARTAPQPCWRPLCRWS